MYHPKAIAPPYLGQDILLLVNTVIIGAFSDVLDCNVEHVI